MLSSCNAFLCEMVSKPSLQVHDDNIARETHKGTWLQRAREKPKVKKKNDYKIKLEDSGQELEQKEESTV